MPLPAPILEMLETHDAQNSLCSSVSSKSKTGFLVKSVLVQDSGGRAQVLVPADEILSLDALFELFGKKFEGVPSVETQPVIEKLGFSSVPAIPNWQGMPTFVEESLLEHDILNLESGDKNQLLEFNQNNFQEIIKDATVGKITIKAPELSCESAEDESQIKQSIQKFTERRIRERLDETLELPPLPETAQKIIKLRADPNADICDLTNVVEVDPSLAAQVVSWAASPYYSAPGKIKSVHDAVVRVLGFDMVLNLALGLALGRTVSTDTLSAFQVSEYWRQSVYTAAAVEGLVTSISREHRPSFGMAYLSGLLNNFGYLILADVFPPYFGNISRLATANPHISRALIEQSVIGVTGNQMAAWLLENWNMPQEVVVGLRQQHNIHYRGEYQEYATLIYVTNQMLASSGFGDSYGENVPKLVFDDLNLDEEAAQLTVGNILESGSDLDEIAEKMRS